MPSRQRQATARTAKTRAGKSHIRSRAQRNAKRKLIAFEPDMLRALDLLARDRMQDFQELADEAFRDILKKHHRPVTLREALKQSTRRTPAND